MSGKRRDTKGRVLRTGENQRKDGKYEYKYIDVMGVRRSVYSWKLVDTDSVPAGRQCTESLRSIEKRIERDKEDGIDTYSGANITLNQCFEMSLQRRMRLKQTTRLEYQSEYDRCVRNVIGKRTINSIGQHHLISIYSSMLSRGLKPRTIETLHNCLKPVFSMAKKKGWIRNDPTEGAIAELKNMYPWEKEKRQSLTEEEQEALVMTVKNTPRFQKYLPLFTFLLGTGCRIGEALALQWEDCNFTLGIISINRTLIYRTGKEDPEKLHMGPPKSFSGNRVIPMLNDVRAALQQLRKQQLVTGVYSITAVDRYQNFVFRNKRGGLLRPTNVYYAMEEIVKFYNKKETAASREENRDPILLPSISPHILRHTFCTRMCENENNLKVIQEIMGHKNISITMEVYADATLKQKKDSFSNLDGKMKIS